MNDPMVKEMSATAPSRWATVVKRANILKRYAAIPRPTVDDMQRCADELECGLRQAYYYVRAWRARAAGLPDPRAAASDKRRHARNDTDGSRLSNGNRTLQYDDGGSAGRARSTFRDCDVVVDCSPLSFDVVDDGRIDVARLLVAIETRTGTILSHRLLAREASVGDTLAILSALPPSGTRVSWTLGIGDGFEFHHSVALAGLEAVLPGITPPPAGSAILAFIGAFLGRVKVMPRRRSVGDPTAAVLIQAASRAIEAMVERHGANLTS